MYHSGHRSYRQARQIKKGEHQLPAHQKVITDWVSQSWGVGCLDFAFEKRQMGGGYREQMVYLAVETLADCETLEKARAEAHIAQCIVGYLQRYPQRDPDPTKQDVFGFNADGSFPPVRIPYCSLETVETEVAARRCVRDVQALARKYAGRIDSISTNNDRDHTIWFPTDADVEAAGSSGLWQAICDDILALMKQHDEFGYFGPHSIRVTADSKQNLDQNFNGQLWQYYR